MGAWDAPPTAAEMGGPADPWGAPPTPEEVGHGAAPKTDTQERRSAAGRVLGALWDTVKPRTPPEVAPVRGSLLSASTWAKPSTPADAVGAASRALTSPDAEQRMSYAAGFAFPGSAPRPTPGPVGGFLRGAAENAALRSTNADRAAFKRVFGRPADVDRAHEVGRYLLDSGVPLRSPAAMQDGLEGALAEECPKVGAFAKRAGASGAQADLEGAALSSLGKPAVADLSKNTEWQALADRVTNFLGDQVQRNGRKVAPDVMHDVRMQLDKLAKWDKTTPEALTDAWRAVRGGVNDEIAATMQRAGLGDEWAAANRNFSLAADAKDLADVGAERRSANRWLSPSESASVGLGGAAAMFSHPAALLLPAATIAAKRFGMPVAARSLDFMAHGAGPADSAYAALMADAARRAAVVHGPIPVAADPAEAP